MNLKKQDKAFDADKTALTGAANAQLTGADFIPQDGDSIERITTLGAQLTNPYLIPNMQQAYRNLGYDPALATVTNLYVRFKPTIAQLATLDSIMDVQGLELFDTPVDFDVTFEGDYYQDPSIPDSLPTWQYAVVPPAFSFPAGIIHETLAQIHIPGDNYTAIETEAENLAAGGGASSAKANIQPDVPQCDVGYHWDYTLLQCVPNNCPEGYKWDGSACVPATCPTGYYYNGTTCVAYQTVPPPPAVDAAIPAGNILVHDTNLPTFPGAGSDLGVRKARVVARRWFTIERVYTDIYGHFVFTKKFKNKVRINVKFKNDDAQIKNIRGGRYWEMLFAVKYTLGIFSGNKSNITKIFGQFTDYKAKGNMFWTVATVHNAVQEYRAYAPVEQIGLPPQGLKIFISKTSSSGNGGGTPMFAKRFIFVIPDNYVIVRISNAPTRDVAALAGILGGKLDMIIGYRYENNHQPDITQLLSDRLKETVYHELTHAAHYAFLGNSWYTTFVNSEIFEIVNTQISDIGYSPYGRGTDGNGPIIALGESWAYYVGHYLADKTYGASSSEQDEPGQGNYTNGNPLGTLNSHLNLLEDFSPFRTGDHFHWIPQGLFYDMIDARNDQTAVPRLVNLDDQVSGYYTNQRLFSAFSSSITTLGNYKTNLLQQNGNIQSTAVNTLFSQYGY